jgi:hypothetical protein
MRIPALFPANPGRAGADAHVCCYLTDERQHKPVLEDARTGELYTPRQLAGRPVEMVLRGDAERDLARKGRRAGYVIRAEPDDRR